MLKTLRFGTRTLNQNLNTITRTFCTRYTEDHEWVNSRGSDIYRTGITDFAQRQLGDVVFIELPSISRSQTQGKEISVVESVKAASEIYMPMDGTVTSVNNDLQDTPELINEDPMGEGWILEYKSSKSDQFNKLMNQSEYDKYVKSQ
ncbi:hypothetical protein ACTA71_007949 [Dictyostelium dimigraforme]